MYQIKIFKNINEIDKKSWDSIVESDNIINKFDFLKAVEESKINDCKFYYLVVYNNANQIVGHACVYTISVDLFIFLKGFFLKIIKFTRKIIPNFCIIKLTECGSPISLGNTFAINTQKEYSRLKIIELIINEMKKIAKENNANLLAIRDFYKKDYKISNEIKSFKFIEASNMPNVEIKIKWKSFNDYINDLRYNYRRFVKKCNNIINQSNLKIEYCYNYSEIIPELLKLYLNCYEHAKEYRREILTENFFKSMNKYLYKKSLVLLLKKNNHILGFAFIVLDDFTARLLYVGMDYKKKEKYNIYFNIFYQGLKFAIENKFKNLELGVTTYEFKIKLGGVIISNYIYLFHNNKIIHFFLKIFKNLVLPKTKLKYRHPFKN